MTDVQQRPDASEPEGDPEITTRLAERSSRGRRRRWKRWVIALAVVGALGGVSVLASGDSDDGPTYETSPVERGPLAVTIAATGRLEASEQVDVGSEVSGKLLAVHVDDNDRVEQGQLLAEVDTTKLQARVREAQGRLRLATSELRAARVDAELAKRELGRSRRLAERGLTAAKDLDAMGSRRQRAQAAIGTARARASIARAALDEAKDDVARARIIAPMAGIVLARNVEEGQTLASAFEVPVLFQIAKDLRELRLSVDIDEADIARVAEGQAATFTVEAHPGRTFASRVVSLRNVPTIAQGVVTYEAVLAVDNHDGLLRPGMTATATIVTERIEDALLVPNAALRFLPIDRAKEEAERAEKNTAAGDDDEPGHRIWVLGDDGPEAIAVEVGRTDGRLTELVSGELGVDIEVLVDVTEVKP